METMLAPLPEYSIGDHQDLGVGVAQLGRSLTVERANKDFFRQFGAEPSEVCGRSFQELVHPSVRQPLMRRFASLMEGKHHRFEDRLLGLRADQSALSAAMTAVAVRSDVPDAPAILVMVNEPKESADPAAGGVLPSRSKLFGKIDAQIIEGIAAGQSTIALAARLHLSRQGVEYHVSGMLRKLRVPNRAALISRVYSMGVLSVGIWPPKVIQDYVK